MSSRQTYQTITITFVLWAIVVFGIALGLESAGHEWGRPFIVVGFILSGLAYFRSYGRHGKA